GAVATRLPLSAPRVVARADARGVAGGALAGRRRRTQARAAGAAQEAASGGGECSRLSAASKLRARRSIDGRASLLLVPRSHQRIDDLEPRDRILERHQPLLRV